MVKWVGSSALGSSESSAAAVDQSSGGESELASSGHDPRFSAALASKRRFVVGFSEPSPTEEPSSATVADGDVMELADFGANMRVSSASRRASAFGLRFSGAGGVDSGSMLWKGAVARTSL